MNDAPLMRGLCEIWSSQIAKRERSWYRAKPVILEDFYPKDDNDPFTRCDNFAKLEDSS